MKNMKKKGFTLVELLVVIAIVAILATVSVIGYTVFIDKANQSADQTAVTEMNTILSDLTLSKDNITVEEVIETLIANKYNGNLTTYYSGYQLAWLASEESIVLVENNAVVYPEKFAGVTGFELINPMATDADALTNGLADGKIVYVADDITAEEGLSPDAAGEYVVNLNGNTLNSNNYVGSWVDGGKLVVSNGVIDATASGQKISVYADEGGYVELTNVQVYSAATANPLQCYGGTMVLNNVTTAQHGVADTSWYNSAIQVVNNITYPEKDPVTNKYVIYGENANLTVNGGMYSGDKAIQISAPGGNVTINSGTFIGTTAVINADFAKDNYTHTEGKTYESVITINGGSFTGNIKVSDDTVLVINGGTFSFNPATGIAKALNSDGSVKTVSSYANITINGTVVDNGNGTWTVTNN